jgi:hypothetical protein
MCQGLVRLTLFPFFQAAPFLIEKGKLKNMDKKTKYNYTTLPFWGLGVLVSSFCPETIAFRFATLKVYPRDL